MSQNGIIGLLLIGLLLGGVALLSRRTFIAAPEAGHHVPASTRSPGNIALVPTKHYKNKETRHIEWNDEGLPVEITIERDYTIG